MEIPNIEERLNFNFSKKPLIIGGKAMEYYGLRKSGKDIDIVIPVDDHNRLREKLDKEGLKYLKGRHKSGYKKIPEFVNLYGDQGILVNEFEIWTCIMKFDYVFLSEDAIETENYLVISLDKLLFLKALGMEKTKYLEDLRLIVEKIIDMQYHN